MKKIKKIKEIGYTTSILSWQIILSAIEMLRNSQSEIDQINLNLKAIPCTVLGCISLEAFSNEISSLTNAFVDDVKKIFNIDNLSTKQKSEIGIDLNNCKDIEQIRNSKMESFYERYKNLLLYIQISRPNFFQELCHLRDIRNAMVHFRQCNISVIEEDGVIKNYQKPPEVFKHIKSIKVNGWPVIAADVKNNSPWNLRISTNAFAFWSIKLILDAITYFLDNLQQGKYREFIFKYYRKEKYSNLFEEGKLKVQELEMKIFK